MIGSLVKSADWKTEKHVPVVKFLGDFKPGEPVEVEVSVGNEIPHPNTVEHHIAWIALYYVADGSQLPVELAHVNFSAHGPDAFSQPVLKTTICVPRPGAISAVAYCNIHGLWQSNDK